MPTRRPKPSPPAADPPVEAPDAVEADIPALEGAADIDVVVDVDVVVVDEDDDEDNDDDDDDDDEDEIEVVEVKPAVRPATRPSPGRPPGAKEEPDPPFFIGERVVLTSNTRPRTGSPIADHAVGATARVETVLSQTAIVRFDRAPDIKEVVAFTCLDSIDDDAKARRAERDAAKEALKNAEA